MQPVKQRENQSINQSSKQASHRVQIKIIDLQINRYCHVVEIHGLQRLSNRDKINFDGRYLLIATLHWTASQ
jgi:hypothetical protein